MNLWGDDCVDHLEEIVDHLIDEAQANAAVPKAIRKALNIPLIGEAVGRHLIRKMVLEAIESPSEEVMSKSDPLNYLPVQTVKGKHPSLQQEHLRVFKEMLQRDYTHQGQGDGVLLVGGGKFWPGIVVAIKMLRRSGCNLPIQVWHQGVLEPIEVEDIRGVPDVTLIDTNAVIAEEGGTRMMSGWISKLYALTRCGFSRVLYLDADAYCVKDPTPMFRVLDDHAFVFWHDLPGNENAVKWPWVWPDGDNGVPAVQGGQLFINLDRGAKLVAIANWMNQHADYYYNHMYGDQDTWRVVLAALNDRSLWHCLGMAPWVSPIAFVIRDDVGDPFIVHRCRGKLFFQEHIPDKQSLHANPHYDRLPREAEVFSIFASCRRPGVTAGQVFETIYSKKLWGEGSGAGSSVREAEPYVQFIRSQIEKYSVTSVTDAGCGDGVVAMMLGINGYIGADCCGSQITRLQKRFPEKTWLQVDFLLNPDHLPAADVLLCKDVLHHLPNADVTAFLTWVKASKRWKHAWFTFDRHQIDDGLDTHLGGYRALALDKEPLKQFGMIELVQYNHKVIAALPLGE